MEAAKFPDHLQSWPNEEMISIAEHDLRIHLAELARADRLHASLRSHRHEGRRLDHAMRGGQAASPRFCDHVFSKKFEHVIATPTSCLASQLVVVLVCPDPCPKESASVHETVHSTVPIADSRGPLVIFEGFEPE